MEVLNVTLNNTLPMVTGAICNESAASSPVATHAVYRNMRIAVDVFIVGVMCVCGFAGNIVSVVVMRQDQDKKNTTNWFLQALAVCDTFYLVMSLFFQTFKTLYTYTNWFPQLKYTIPYIEPYIWAMASIAQTGTVWLVVLVTADRYIAVCKPLSTNLRTLERAKITTVLVLCFAVIYNIPRFLEREWIEEYDPCHGEIIVKSVRTQMRNSKLYFLLYKTICYFLFRTIVPLVTLIILNLRLIRALQQVHRRHRDMTRSSKHRENITLMLVVVVSVFIVCLIPDMTLRIVATLVYFFPSIDIDLQTLRYINIITNMLLTVNSAINFLIYCLVGKKFRKILQKMCCKAKKPMQGEVSESEPLTMRTTVVPPSCERTK